MVIKHKAKAKINNSWVEGFYASKQETTYCFKEDYEKNPVETKHYIIQDTMTDWGMPNQLRPIEIDEATVCVCTGRKDCEDKLIWEHDILFDKEEGDYLLVRWDEERGSFVLDAYALSGALMEYGWDETAGAYDVVETYTFNDFISLSPFEVAGNVFDNPELIGKSKEE